MNPEYDSLDLVPTEVLVDALARRYPSLVAVLSKSLDAESDGAFAVYRGGWLTALGLLEFGKREIMDAPSGTRDAEDA